MKRQFFEHFAHHAHQHGGPRRFMRGFDRNFERGFERGFGGWKGRTRRGDMKYLVLDVLAAGPRHGYEIIGAIEEKRGFRPSPGSIYPTLQMLEDGSFVTSAEVEGKRVYTITDAGRTLLAGRGTENDDEETDEAPGPRERLKGSAMKLAAAVMGARGSDEATIDKVRGVLDKARKEIYAILASDVS
jgi:DNA-binding PadR family transcriptional regulator